MLWFLEEIRASYGVDGLRITVICTVEEDVRAINCTLGSGYGRTAGLVFSQRGCPERIAELSVRYGATAVWPMQNYPSRQMLDLLICRTNGATSMEFDPISDGISLDQRLHDARQRQLAAGAPDAPREQMAGQHNAAAAHREPA